MPFDVDPELLAGPVSGLMISFVFAFTMYQIFQQFFSYWKASIERLIVSFETEIIACEHRYTVVLKELLEIRHKG